MPLSLSFAAIPVEIRTYLRNEIANLGPPLPRCGADEDHMREPPLINSPVNNKVYKENEKVMFSFEKDCRYKDYRDNRFVVQIEYKPNKGLEQNVFDPGKDGYGKSPLFQDPILIDMEAYPVKNVAESRGWAHVALRLPGRYRIKARNRILHNGQFIHGDWTSEWVYFWVGKPDIDNAEIKDAPIIAPPPDLTVSEFEGKLVLPGDTTYDYQVAQSRSYNFRWTVKNIGKGSSRDTTLRIRCVADGDVPCPWGDNVKDFSVGRPDNYEHNTLFITALFPASEGVGKFRFNAKVDPDDLILETDEVNNIRLSQFDPTKISAGTPGDLADKLHLSQKAPRMHFIASKSLQNQFWRF